MPRFRLHRLVDFEFWEAAAWYKERSPLAAENFADSFEAALAAIERSPTAHPPWQRPFRRLRLKRFPYLVLFHADRRSVSVLALAHERREPRRVLRDLTRRQKEFL